jgi:two-component system sensor histidine kinase KdpD
MKNTVSGDSSFSAKTKDISVKDGDSGLNDNSKFLVCISASPSSERIIRWTAKTAAAFGCCWIALYIETPDAFKLNENDNETLRKNIALAKLLGGEFVQIEGYNIADSVAEYARQSSITNIVIGKSRNKRSIKNFFEKDLENQIISLLENVEVHIIPYSINAKIKNKTRAKVRLSAFDFLKTIAALCAATALSYLLRLADLSEVNFILIYLLAVVTVSIVTKGYIYGLLSSILSVLLFDFLFVEPNFAFHAIQSDYIVIFGTMFIVSFILSMLTIRVKNQSFNAVMREKRLENLYGLSQKILKVRGYDNIVFFISDYISLQFKSQTAVFTKLDGGGYLRWDKDKNKRVCTAENEKNILERFFETQKASGAQARDFTDGGKIYIPVRSQDTLFAVICIDYGKNKILSEEEITFLKMVSSHFALALERQRLSDSQNEVMLAAETEKMRSTLLRSVSHDLRTPLTAIYGSALAISDSGNLDENTKRTLVESIKDDSQWLIRMVENLLTVTRIKSDGLKLAKQPEAVEEIIAEAVSRVKHRLGKNNISVKVPDELLVVPMDATLIEQVLINLLDNAIRHSGSEENVEITAQKSEGFAVIKVADKGVGLNDETLEMLNKGMPELAVKPSDSKKGMGIGLSICCSIIKAHGGFTEACNRQGGGAEITVTLPTEEK